MKKSDINQKAVEIKNFFVKMKIVKDNFRFTLITTFLLSVLLLGMGLVIFF